MNIFLYYIIFIFNRGFILLSIYRNFTYNKAKNIKFSIL